MSFLKNIWGKFGHTYIRIWDILCVNYLYNSLGKWSGRWKCEAPSTRDGWRRCGVYPLSSPMQGLAHGVS